LTCHGLFPQGIQYLVDNDLLEWTAEAVAEFLYKEEGLNKTAIGNFLGERYTMLLNMTRIMMAMLMGIMMTVITTHYLNNLHITDLTRLCSCREEMHLQTLKAFVELHEFSDLNLVQALRLVLHFTSASFTLIHEYILIIIFISTVNPVSSLAHPCRQFLWSFRLPGEAQKIDRMMEAFATRYCDCNAGVFQSTGTVQYCSAQESASSTMLLTPYTDRSARQMGRGLRSTF
jgi:cytohesin